jgi:hypothetical protein
MNTQQGPKYDGEPSLEAIASGLGSLGRYGDDYMVHAAHGETVVPAEILQANPQLKADLFRQMQLMGIKDPNRYVVGNALNSINPLTGQPEFFFKKIFRAVRKVFKKVAPIVVPIIGNMIAPGIGGPIASALLTKVQGGDWGDALKSAAFSYGAQALGSGIRGLAQAPAQSGMEGFWTGLKKGALAPYEAASNLFASGPENPLAQGIFGPRGAGLIFSEGAKGIAPYASTMDAIFPVYQSSPTVTPRFNAPPGQGVDPVTGQLTSGRAALDASNIGAGPQAGPGPVNQLNTTTQPNAIYTDRGIPIDQSGAAPTTTSADGFEHLNRVKGSPDAFTIDTKPSNLFGDTMAGRFLENNPAIEHLGGKVLEHTVGPAVATGLAYYLASEDEDPNLDEDDIAQMTDPQARAWGQYNAQRGRPDWDTWRTTPEARSLLAEAGIHGPQYQLADISRITGVNPNQINPHLYGASGGIASLQGGGEVMGPGTGTSDSIPARLSDGEFVMTAEAVRNAGKGDRNLGAARMYDLMQRFEGAPA